VYVHRKGFASVLLKKVMKAPSFVYTPRHCSWLNQVEIWLSILARRLLKRSSFTSLDDLRSRTLAFVEYFNKVFYKRLDVYNCAIELLALAAEILESIAKTKGNAVLADQLKRAALSVPLNIGEGAGKSTPADQTSTTSSFAAQPWSAAQSSTPPWF